MNNCIVRYNINYKGFSFGTSLKSEIMNSIIKLVKKDTIDWEVVVIIFQQNQKKFQDILRKGRIK